MCGQNSPTLQLFDLLRPHRGERPAGGNLGQDEKEEEEKKFFGKENGKYFWIVSGDLIHRHHEVRRSKLYVPNAETFTILVNIGRRDEAHANEY